MREESPPEADEGKKGPLRLMREESPPCYEADDRLTPDEQGLEADEGGKLPEANKGKKSPLCL